MILLIGDLHLTDNARDAYRFDIFKWLKRQQRKWGVTATFFAGDVTDAKDRHSATLVNKTVAGFRSLEPPVYIARGNHDYKNPNNPFFNFLNHMEGIRFVNEPEIFHGLGVIPHYRAQDEFNAAIGKLSRPDGFLVHQTFDGAIAETGARLTGLSASPIELLKPPLGVYAGDVHRPQRQGIVTYVGCPYQVRFGDDYDPRVLIINKTKEYELKFPAPRKWSLKVRDPIDLYNNESLFEGDQVKLTIELAREEAVEWKKIKSEILTACREMKLEVYGASLEINTIKSTKKVRFEKSNDHASILDQFCKRENVSLHCKKTGHAILEEKDGN